jgi:segregation and condensation protein A
MSDAPAPDSLPDSLPEALPEALIVDVEGFEGPLDLLLALSRTQKVDLRRISVLALADQYLAFVARARAGRIELAADYLVMAAWLAYLKSRLLLPPDPRGEEPAAEDMAAALALRLERLQAMRDAAARLMARDQLGRDVFPRGAPEEIVHVTRTVWTASLLDLLQAYARLRTRDDFRPWAFDRSDVFTMEEALERLRGMLGDIADWAPLEAWLPPGWTTPARRRSATAATFAAALELARQGKLSIRQAEPFAPIGLRPIAPG